MNFEINGQRYFLNFVDDEGHLIVFTPTETGMLRIPVESDRHVDHFLLPATADEEKVM